MQDINELQAKAEQGITEDVCLAAIQNNALAIKYIPEEFLTERLISVFVEKLINDPMIESRANEFFANLDAEVVGRTSAP